MRAWVDEVVSVTRTDFQKGGRRERTRMQEVRESAGGGWWRRAPWSLFCLPTAVNLRWRIVTPGPPRRHPRLCLLGPQTVPPPPPHIWGPSTCRLNGELPWRSIIPGLKAEMQSAHGWREWEFKFPVCEHSGGWWDRSVSGRLIQTQGDILTLGVSRARQGRHSGCCQRCLRAQSLRWWQMKLREILPVAKCAFFETTFYINIIWASKISNTTWPVTELNLNKSLCPVDTCVQCLLVHFRLRMMERRLWAPTLNCETVKTSGNPVAADSVDQLFMCKAPIMSMSMSPFLAFSLPEQLEKVIVNV